LFHNNRVDVACLTETWLHHKISSYLIRAKYYSCYHKDRNDGSQGGGVAFYVTDDVSCTQLSDLESPKFEILWLLYRQPLMPRILSHILIGGIYHPSAAKHTDTIAYIPDCLDAVSKLHPGLGILLIGDFNQLPDSAIHNFPLTQIVRRPTRGKAILDKMFTDCRDWYNEPEILPPVSGSDHCGVLLLAHANSKYHPTRVTKYRHCYDQNRKTLFAEELQCVSWLLLYQAQSCSDMVNMFYTVMMQLIDYHFPIIESRQMSNDKPWVTDRFRQLIRARQSAYHSGNVPLPNKYRNEAQRLAKRLRKQYFERKV